MTIPTLPIPPTVFDALLASMEDLTQAQPKLFALLYGPMGTGKTTLAFKILDRILPPDKRIAYFDTGQGWVVLQNLPQSEYDRIRRRTSRYQFQAISHITTFARAVAEGHPKFVDFGAVILDESTWMTDIALDKLTRGRAAQDATKDPDEPKWPDMNATQHVWLNMEQELIKTGLHVVFTGHDRKDQDDRKVEVTSPNFLPKLIAKVCQPMHLVGYVNATQTEKEGGEVDYRRLVQVHPTRRITAKTRIPNLPINVDHNVLIDAIGNFISTGELTDEEPMQILPSEYSGSTELDPAIVTD